jgi:dTDP-4-dehydrorhamnose 3,5-epimerase
MATAEYAPELEAGVIWNDSELAIDWPIAEPVLSPRDRAWPALKLADTNFSYGGA